MPDLYKSFCSLRTPDFSYSINMASWQEKNRNKRNINSH